MRVRTRRIRGLRTALLSLIAAVLWIPAASAGSTPPAPQLPGIPSGNTLMLVHILTPTAHSPLRERLIARLATPNLAVALVVLGVLLIFVECNLPGAILPGATGLLLLLSGVFGLSLLPLHLTAVAVLFAAAALLALSPKASVPAVPAIAGTAGLIYGLWNLVQPAPLNAALHPAVHPALAISAGLVLGISASLLGRVAEQARRNKSILVSGAPSAPGQIPR